MRLLLSALAAFTVFTALTTANATVQLAVAPRLRGRVMALYMAILMGGTPLGAPLVGWVGNVFGPRATLLVAAVGAGSATLVAGAALMRHRHYDAADVLAMRPRRRRRLPGPVGSVTTAAPASPRDR